MHLKEEQEEADQLQGVWANEPDVEEVTEEPFPVDPASLAPLTPKEETYETYEEDVEEEPNAVYTEDVIDEEPSEEVDDTIAPPPLPPPASPPLQTEDPNDWHPEYINGPILPTWCRREHYVYNAGECGWRRLSDHSTARKQGYGTTVRWTVHRFGRGRVVQGIRCHVLSLPPMCDSLPAMERFLEQMLPAQVIDFNVSPP